MVGNGERIAVAAIAELELALVIRRTTDRWARCPATAAGRAHGGAASRRA